MEKVEKLHLDIDSILVNFNLPRLRDGILINQWISVKGTLPNDEEFKLKKLHKKALQSGDGWNESQRRTVRTKNELRRQSDSLVYFSI